MHKPLISGQEAEARLRFSGVMLWAFVLCTCIVKFVPFVPDFPSGGLDPSWQFAMNHAIATGMHFGTEINFTFGPYAPVYTRLYHPALDGLVLTVNLYLGVAYALAAFLAFRHGPRSWVLVYAVFLAGTAYFRDPLLFSLPLLLALALWNAVFLEQRWLMRVKLGPLSLALLFAPLGLLPLVKGSLLLLCVAVSLLCAALLASLGRRALCAACLLGPLAAMSVFWVAARQPVEALPAYFAGMLPIISGYSEAMAHLGMPLEIAAFLGAGALMLRAIALHPLPARRARLFLGALFLLFLFLAFKAGFVRHDGHAVIAAGTLVLAGIALLLVLPSRDARSGAFASLLAWLLVSSGYMPVSPDALADNVSAPYRQAWQGAILRLTTPNWTRDAYEASLQAQRTSARLPRLRGGTDIYSYHQADLLATGIEWSPRPVMQSYSAYTPILAERNRQHLLGPRAPENVIFRVETIDGRFPSLDDGASWPVLLAGYRPERLLGDAVLLRKSWAAPRDVQAAVTPLQASERRFGETVALPSTQGKIFVQMEVNPSMLGRLAGLLFHPDQLQLTVSLHDGRRKTYRLVSGMARSGFVLSPLVEDSKDFLQLYGENALLDGKRVVSISLGTSSGNTWYWESAYRIVFSQLPPLPPADVAALPGIAR